MQVRVTAFNRTILRVLLLGSFLIPNFTKLPAQFFQSGQDAASIRWKQINTEHFQIIFSPEFEKEANRLANTLNYLYNQVSKSLNHKPRKISVLLHSQSVTSNGMVTWAPKRMELYTTPAQDNYAQDWLDQLAVHELRHVVQIDKLNQGITQIAGILFGQQAVGAVTGLLPRWFLEGDAVNTETALTGSGRGRTASFEMEMKALVTSRDSLFSYEKALRGSYKDHIPDPYQLGYPMVAWTRKNYGSSVFDNSLNYIGQNPFTLFPFPLSLKKQIGLPSRKLYKATYTDMRHQWQMQLSKVQTDTFKTWNTTRKKHYTSYRFPQFINDSTIIAVKSGIDQLTEFVLVHKDGREEKIHTPGYFTNDKFSYADGKFVWTEEIPDIRWTNRSYNCIKIGDLRTNNVTLLTRKTRYFAPSLSKDGKKIATVEVSPANEIFLVILESKTGKVMEKIPSPNNNFLQLPEWMINGNEIVMITTNRKGKNLVIYDVASKTWSTLITHTAQNITLPADAGEYILFTADYNGTDNLYAINRKDTSIWQITNARYGITDAKYSANSQSICFAQYSSQGFNLATSKLNSLSFRNKNEATNTSAQLYLASAKQEGFNFQDSILPDKKFQVTSYSKLAHAINVHSWAPFYYDYNSMDVNSNSALPGFTILSQDKLGTCVASTGLAFDQGQAYWKNDITYLGLYPVIEFTSSYGGTPIINNETIWYPKVEGNNFKTAATIYVPFDLTQSCYITGITPLAQWEYRNEWFLDPHDSSYYKGMHYITFGLNASSYLRMSYRDLAPKWGISFATRVTSTPFDNLQFNPIWYVWSRLYLPGLFNHHSLQITVGYQEQIPRRYLSASRLPYPRGYLPGYSKQLTTFSSDYSFPIFYPDFALGALLYAKRIRSNLFYDLAFENHSVVDLQTKKRFWQINQLSSLGIDLTADFHFLRIIFPINAGVRMIYAPELKQYTSQLLFNVDLSNY